ncbi:MAG: glycosyltransferase family 39 protein [Actinobacteria bacterium]|nr:glycosyltransferase family 39 protein [Actinomycetota bacterium]
MSWARRIRRPPHWALLAGITALGAALRLPSLGRQSFTVDELYTAWLVHMPTGRMLSTIPKTESTPYLYYLAVHAWAHAGGYSEASLRLISALAGIGTVPVAAAAARALASRRVGLAVAALVAANPLMVSYSQQARAYALATFLAAVALWAFAEALSSWETRWLVMWSAASCLAIATHYFAAMPFVAQAAWLLVAAGRRRGARPVAIAVGPAVITGIALIPLVWTQRSHPGGTEAASLAVRVVQLPASFVVGYATPAKVPVTIAGAILTLVAIVGLPRLTGRPRSGGAVGGAMALATVVPPLLLALAGVDLVVAGRFLQATVPVTLVIAAGALATRAGRWALGGLVALSIAVVVVSASGARVDRQDFRGVARFLGPPRPSRAMVFQPDLAAGPFGVYFPGATRARREVRLVSEVDLIALAVEGQYSARQLRPPPPPRRPPRLRGFRLVRERTASSYTALVYRAPRPAAVDLALLDLLSLDRTQFAGVWTQRPRGAPRTGHLPARTAAGP